MTRKTRSDRKFNVKVWVKPIDKDIFRTHCYSFHLSMMFVGEKYVTTVLDTLNEHELESVIESRLDTYLKMNSRHDNYEVLGLRFTNNYWQRLAYFAVLYKTSVAKVASCLFQYSLDNYELKNLGKQYGLTFVERRGR